MKLKSKLLDAIWVYKNNRWTVVLHDGTKLKGQNVFIALKFAIGCFF